MNVCCVLVVLVLASRCMIWYEWFMSSCCCCVNNQRLEHLSSSLSLSLYLFMHSVTHILSLFSLSSLRSLCRSLYLSTLDLGNNGQKNRTCLFLLILRSPSPRVLSFSSSLSLSLSLAPPVHLFLLAPGLSVCHPFHLKRARKRQKKQQTLISFTAYLVCYLLRWLVGWLTLVSLRWVLLLL